MNILKDFIDYHIGIAEARKQDKHAFGEEAFFNEYRLFYAIGARQSGTTTLIAEIFNPETDIYVGHNSGCVDDFVNNKLPVKPNVVFTNTSRFYDDKWNKVRGVVSNTKIDRIYLDFGKSADMKRLQKIVKDIFNLFPNAYVIVT